MLEINNVQSGYGDIRVLRGINLGLSQGEFVGLWGHNGMGKSTLMRTILGYLPARNGAIRFDGRDITTIAPDAPPTKAAQIMVTNNIGHVPVVLDGEVIGIVTRTDILTYYYDLLPD